MTQHPQHPQPPQNPQHPPHPQPHAQHVAHPGGPAHLQPATDDRGWAVLAHLSGLIAAVLSVGLLSILGPLAIYLLGRNRSPLVRQAAAGSFNFNLTIWAAFVVGWALFATIILIPVAVVILLAAAGVGLYCHLSAAVKANRGEPYHYPFQIPVLR